MFEYSTLFLSLLKSNASYQENPDPAKKNKKIYIVLSFSPIKNSGEVKTWSLLHRSISLERIYLPVRNTLTNNGSPYRQPDANTNLYSWHHHFPPIL